MAKAGLTPPDTWTKLLDFCRAAKAKGTPAFALGNQDNWVTQLVLYALVATTVYGDDRDFDKKMQAGQATFAKSPWTDGPGQVRDDGEDRLLPEEPPGHQLRGQPGPRRDRQDARHHPGQLGDRPAEGEEPEGHVHAQGAAGRPTTRSKTLIPAAAGAGYGVNAKAKNKELALKFVDFVMSPEGMNLFVEKQGGLPSLPDTGFVVEPVAGRAVRVHQGRPDRAVHGPALAQRQGPADHAQRSPGDLQRPVHPRRSFSPRWTPTTRPEADVMPSTGGRARRRPAGARQETPGRATATSRCPPRPVPRA